MIDVSVKVDDEDFSKAMADLRHIEGGIETATIRAINRTLEQVQTIMIREARAKYNMTRDQVKSQIRVTKSRKNIFSGGTSEGSIKSTGKPIPLYKFDPVPSFPMPQVTRWMPRDIYVTVLKNTRKKVGGQAFIAKMKSGHTGIFWREKRGDKKVGRLPIIELFGPRLENFYAKELVDTGRIQIEADERMKKNFEHNVDYLFRKKNEMV